MERDVNILAVCAAILVLIVSCALGYISFRKNRTKKRVGYAFAFLTGLLLVNTFLGEPLSQEPWISNAVQAWILWIIIICCFYFFEKPAEKKTT